MHLLRIFLLLSILPASAQHLSKLGRFSADYNNGCAPFTINLTELDPYGAIDRQYLYRAPVNLTATTATTFTYTTPGTYHIVQIISAPVTPNVDTLTVVVHASTLPQFEYNLCDNRQVEVELTDPTFDSYFVEFAGSSQATGITGETLVYTYGPSDALTIAVRGRYANAPDGCTTRTIVLPEIIDNLTAPDLSSASLRQVCEGTFALQMNAPFNANVTQQIAWNQDGGSYELLAESKFSGAQVFSSIDFSETSGEYCIRVNSVNRCDNSVEFGNPLCIAVPAGSLDPVRNLYSTYSGNQIVVVLDPTTLGQYAFRRSFNGTNYSQVHTRPSSFTDTSPFNGRQYTYQVSYLDSCGGDWGMKETSPPFIRATPLQTNTYTISFSEAVHASTLAFDYKAYLNDIEIPLPANSFEITLDPSGGDRQKLVIIGTAGGTEVYSNTLLLNYEFTVGVPKAFTPNGDGLNDALEIFGLNGVTAQLRIYTKWGHLIYSEVSASPSWDGRIAGALAEEGVYVYEISIPDQANRRQKGTFVLIKN